MITQFAEISLTLIGDGTSREVSIDLDKLSQNILNALPRFAPTAIVANFCSLIGPDGSTKEEATFALSGKTLTVKVANPL